MQHTTPSQSAEPGNAISCDLQSISIHKSSGYDDSQLMMALRLLSRLTILDTQSIVDGHHIETPSTSQERCSHTDFEDIHSLKTISNGLELFFLRHPLHITLPPVCPLDPIATIFDYRLYLQFSIIVEVVRSYSLSFSLPLAWKEFDSSCQIILQHSVRQQRRFSLVLQWLSVPHKIILLRGRQTSTNSQSDQRYVTQHHIHDVFRLSGL